MESLALCLSGLFTAPSGNFRSWFLKIIMPATLTTTVKILSHRLWCELAAASSALTRAARLCACVTSARQCALAACCFCFVSSFVGGVTCTQRVTSTDKFLLLAHLWICSRTGLSCGDIAVAWGLHPAGGLPVVTRAGELSRPSPVAAFILLCQRRCLSHFPKRQMLGTLVRTSLCPLRRYCKILLNNFFKKIPSKLFWKVIKQKLHFVFIFGFL